MVTIGAELPKLSQNKTGYPFFGPPCRLGLMAHVYSTAVAMVQAVNYSVMIVKIKCKTHNIADRKRLPWCELINRYIFSHSFSHCQCISLYDAENVSARRWSSRDFRESRELQGLGQRLGSCNVSSRIKFWTSRSRRHGSRLGLGSEGLVHIAGTYHRKHAGSKSSIIFWDYL